MPGLLGKKIGMTSVFSADGKNVPCTVIEVGPCVVTQVKTVETDGYEALQLGFVEKKDKHTTKPMAGHFKKAGVKPQRFLAEFKGFDGEHKAGDEFTVELFNDVDEDVCTKEGIRVGASASDVIAAYGEASTHTDSAIVYENTAAKTRLQFLLRDGKVTNIQYLKSEG